MPGIAREDALEPCRGLGRAVGDDDHAGVQAVADADAAAVVEADPGRARGRVDQGVEDRPVGDGVGAVAHGLGLAVRAGHRAGVEVIAADDDRRRHLARRDELVEAKPGLRAIAVAEPADARGEALDRRPSRRPGASSAGGRRRPGRARPAPGRWRAMSSGSPESAAPRNGPLPSQNSGRMKAGTKPGKSKAFSTPASFAHWRGCCCRSRRSRAPARLEGEHGAHVLGHGGLAAADVVLGIRCAERQRLGQRYAVRDVAVERVVGADVWSVTRSGCQPRRTSSGRTSAALPMSATDRPMRSRAPAVDHGERLVERVGQLVDVARRRGGAGRAPRRPRRTRHGALVHRDRERLRAAHAAEAGGERGAFRPACRRSAGARPRRRSRTCPGGSPACRCRSTSRRSSGRTSSGPSRSSSRKCSQVAQCGTRLELAMRTRGASAWCGRRRPACRTGRAASRRSRGAGARRRSRRRPPRSAPPGPCRRRRRGRRGPRPPRGRGCS